MDASETGTTLAYCASCVEELLNEGIATASDLSGLVRLPETSEQTCSWCRVARAMLVQVEGEAL